MNVTETQVYWYSAGVVVAFLLAWLYNVLNHMDLYNNPEEVSFSQAIILSLFSWVVVIVAIFLLLSDLKPRPKKEPKWPILRNLWNKGRFT